jgi:predicted nucleic acid-binding Zn ribbon protein
MYQGIKDTPLTACPTCGGPVRRKIGTGGGLLFKGSGFYVTDYRSTAYQQKAKDDHPSTPASGETKAAPPAPGAAAAPGAAPASGAHGTSTSHGTSSSPGSSAPSGSAATPPSSTGSSAGGEKTP